MEAQYKVFVANTATQAKKLLLHLNEYVPQAVQALDMLRDKALRDLPRAGKCSRFWVYDLNDEGKPVNDPTDYRTVYLQYRLSGSEQRQGPMEIIQPGLYNALSSVLLSQMFSRLCLISSLSKPVDGCFDDRHGFLGERCQEEMGKAVPRSYLEILEILASSRLTRVLDEGLQLVSMNAEATERMLQPDYLQGTEEDKCKVLDTAVRKISDYYYGLTFLLSLTQAAMEFVNGVTPVLAAFSAVLDREAA